MLVLDIQTPDKGEPLDAQAEQQSLGQVSVRSCPGLSEWMFPPLSLLNFPSHLPMFSPFKALSVSALWLSNLVFHSAEELFGCKYE